MRGFLVIGLMATAALALVPNTSAQAEVVNSKFDAVVFEAFAGNPLPIGQGSFANLNFQWCYDQGGLANPSDQATVTIEITQKPEWAEVALSATEIKFTIDNTKAASPTASERCKVPSPAVQVQVVRILDSAKGGESGTVDLLIKGTKVGTIKAPADATASAPLGVATPEAGLLEELANATANAPDVDIGAEGGGGSNDSPGFDLLAPVAVGAAVLVVAARRRRYA